MLDFPSSTSRKWAGMGIVFIVFSMPVGVRMLETGISGNLTYQFATMSLSGSNRDPVLVFQAKTQAASCTLVRCNYAEWRDDIGSTVEVGFDEEMRVSSIAIRGVNRLSVSDLHNRSMRSLQFAGLLLITGLVMCIKAWRVNKVNKVNKESKGK